MRWMGPLPILVVAAACRGGGGRAHAPTDRDLDLAIVVPPDMKSVEVGLVDVERSAVFPDAAAFAADEAAHNRSYTVGEPTADGDGWVVPLASHDADFPDVRIWYRPLGGGLAITCDVIRPFGPATAHDLELGRKVCFGARRVDRGVFVPFHLSRNARIHVELARVDEPLNWSVDLERPAISPPWRFDPKGSRANQTLLDRGTLAGGTWWISSGATAGGTHYDVVARRTISGLDLVCYGDNYRSERYTRRQLALCRALQQP